MNLREQFIAGCDKLGIDITGGQAGSFMAYMDELVKWNRKVNLTAIDRPAEILTDHFLDSLALCPLLPAEGFRAADVGAGAGLPGLAIKLVRPDMDLTLVEPARKKATFLRHIIRTLGLRGAAVADRRIEEVAAEAPAGFDIIFSRAFAEPATLVSLAGPALSPGGRFILSMGPSWDGAAPDGWGLERIEPVTIPFTDRARRLVSITRNRPQ